MSASSSSVKQKRQLRRDLFAKNPDCPLCDRRMVLKFKGRRQPSTLATLDHVHAQAFGGSDQPDNLMLICARCNQDKGAMTTTEYKSKMAADRCNAALSAATKESLGTEGFEIPAEHVVLACKMCESMGLDPNAAVVDGSDAKNWQFLLPAAATACFELQPVPPEGDMMSVAAPDGNGWIFRIDKDGQLHIREDLAPNTPLFTLVNKSGDVTLAMGPPPLQEMKTANDEEKRPC